MFHKQAEAGIRNNKPPIIQSESTTADHFCIRQDFPNFQLPDRGRPPP